MRAHRKALGVRVKGGAKLPSVFDAGEFVAIDGEGFNEGAEESFDIDGSIYTGRPHNYAMLASSDGSEICAPDGARLGSKDCLDFLIDQAGTAREPRILVCFGASYDMTQWLRDLTREQVYALMKGDGSKFARCYVDITLGQHDYRIECQMRKCMKVWRWPAGADKYYKHVQRNGRVIWKLTDCARVTVWDAWGFFQGTFVSALQEWLPSHPDTALIIDMKKRRAEFDRSETATIREYNRKEVALLVAMMERVREAVRALDLKITRWDGAGAIASAMFRLHKVKAHMGESPPEVFEAARHAYSGGHIEQFKLGLFASTVHHYDINSAYPHWFRNLPSLSDGTWHHGTTGNPPDGFTLVRVSYSYVQGLPFYPLFHREGGGRIIYPHTGSGWYWFAEFDVARRFAERFGAARFDVHEWWHWQSYSNARPFAWIEDYYTTRRDMITAARREKREPPGETKTFKLGYNACYGKTAQQVGARWQDGELKIPGFFQLEWSGYVTAGCRSQIMAAAMQSPADIIALATDGIFSTVPLDLPGSASKELGEWEYKQHSGMTIVMPGVYWLDDEHHSRGFEKEDLEDVEVICDAWRRRRTAIPVSVKRLITLGSAITSEHFWAARGRFVASKRMLKIDADNSKRYGVPMSSAKPHQGLVNTHPKDHNGGLGLIDELDPPMSAPYPIAWLEPEGDAPSWDWEDHDITAAIEF